MLPTGLTTQLVNNAPAPGHHRGLAAEWTMVQLRDAAQRTTDRIHELIRITGTEVRLLTSPHTGHLR